MKTSNSEDPPLSDQEPQDIEEEKREPEKIIDLSGVSFIFAGDQEVKFI